MEDKFKSSDALYKMSNKIELMHKLLKNYIKN